MQLKLFLKERYLSILLSILLFLSINISSYNHIVLGKEDEIIEKDEEEDEKDFEYISINELFDNKDENDDNDNRDSSREDDIIEKDKEEDDVPFILPFNAVPFP